MMWIEKRLSELRFGYFYQPKMELVKNANVRKNREKRQHF